MNFLKWLFPTKTQLQFISRFNKTLTNENYLYDNNNINLGSKDI